jgi:hypothetical protein
VADFKPKARVRVVQFPKKYFSAGLCAMNLPIRMVSSGMLRRVALVRTDVSEELSASFIRLTRIGKLGTTLAVTTTDARCEEIPSALIASYS